MVRLGKMESAHASIKAYHIDFVSSRASNEESKLASVEGTLRLLATHFFIYKPLLSTPFCPLTGTCCRLQLDTQSSAP